MAHRLQHRQHRLVAELAQQRLADVVKGPDKRIEQPLPLRRTGEKALDRQLPGVGVDLSQARQHPLGMAVVRAHRSGGEQGAGQVVRVLKLDGVFLIDIAVKHAAQKPLKGAVVAVNCLHSESLLPPLPKQPLPVQNRGPFPLQQLAAGEVPAQCAEG